MESELMNENGQIIYCPSFDFFEVKDKMKPILDYLKIKIKHKNFLKKILLIKLSINRYVQNINNKKYKNTNLDNVSEIICDFIFFNNSGFINSVNKISRWYNSFPKSDDMGPNKNFTNLNINPIVQRIRWILKDKIMCIYEYASYTSIKIYTILPHNINDIDEYRDDMNSIYSNKKSSINFLLKYGSVEIFENLDF